MRILIGLIILALGAIVGWYILGGKNPIDLPNALRPTPVPRAATPAPDDNLLRASGITGFASADGMEKGGVVSRTVVTYTDTGFSPSPLTVAPGATVTFVNESGSGMWVASAVHPTHQVLPGFDQKRSVDKGGTYDFTFMKVGTWRYHNHVRPEITGVVVVQ